MGEEEGKGEWIGVVVLAIAVLFMSLSLLQPHDVDLEHIKYLNEMQEKGYADGLKGNISTYQICNEFIYSMESKYDLIFALGYIELENNTTYRYCEGFIEGYKENQTAVKERQYQENISKLPVM